MGAAAASTSVPSASSKAPIVYPTTRRARRVPGSAALLAVCIVGTAFRFATLGVQSFDFDESYTVGIVLNGSLGHALQMVPITESSPPLYYVLAWFWSQIFGLGEFGIRSLSALLGAALVAVAYFIGRRLGSHRAGLIAALLVAVNPLMVWYSQEARTYALLALLSALSFWAFVRALDQAEPRSMALWAIASSLAVLSHYFAAFLVGPEAVWLVLATRRRSAILATAAVAAVGAALVPLVISQADNRTQWIEKLGLWSRVREVAKKWVTGEIAPTRNWQLAVIGLSAGIVIVYAATRLSGRERRGAVLAVGAGGAALLTPLILDVAGLHYLISKNVMPALAVLLIGTGLILGAEGARIAGAAGAAVVCVFFLAITLDGAVNPALRRPDYRAAASGLGPAARDQVIVSPHLGYEPLAVYRPGAKTMPAGGWPTSRVVVALPLPRADTSDRRPPTPAAPAGFVFEGRRDARTYTLICFDSPVPRTASPRPLIALAGTDASAQIWPAASATADAGRTTGSPCSASR
jgi:4-amino-4-deoxy-L-arabinose transferase-like glycosyltransferase